jgi:hypothetical protein
MGWAGGVWEGFRCFVSVDILSIYALSHYTFFPYMLCYIRPFVVRIRCVALYFLFVYVLSR